MLVSQPRPLDIKARPYPTLPQHPNQAKDLYYYPPLRRELQQIHKPHIILPATSPQSPGEKGKTTCASAPANANERASENNRRPKRKAIVNTTTDRPRTISEAAVARDGMDIVMEMQEAEMEEGMVEMGEEVVVVTEEGVDAKGDNYKVAVN